jgi:uncharacterized protein
VVWLVDNIEVKNVTFSVDEQQLAGVLRVPDVGRPVPGLVFMGPLTSVKDQVTGNYAEAMARRGFITFSFDHRHFGESGGQPRQYEHPGRKVEDLRTAVRYVKSQVEVAPLRIGAVGICAGAGYLSHAAARERRIAAWATVAGFFHRVEATRQSMGEEAYQAAIDRARAARERFEQTGFCEMIPAVGEGDVAMPMAEASEYYGTERGASPHWINGFAVMSREQTLPWDAHGVAPEIKIPTFMVHSEKALAPAFARAFYEQLAGPKQELWLESKGHIDFYDDPQLIGPACDALAKFFRTNM